MEASDSHAILRLASPNPLFIVRYSEGGSAVQAILANEEF
jgi:hypothetical protein